MLRDPANGVTKARNVGGNFLWFVRALQIVAKIDTVSGFEFARDAGDEVFHSQGLSGCDIDVATEVTVENGNHRRRNIRYVHKIPKQAAVAALGTITSKQRVNNGGYQPLRSFVGPEREKYACPGDA